MQLNKHVKANAETQHCHFTTNKEWIWSVSNALVAHCSLYTIGLWIQFREALMSLFVYIYFSLKHVLCGTIWLAVGLFDAGNSCCLMSVHCHRKWAVVNGLIDIRVIKWAFNFDAAFKHAWITLSCCSVAFFKLFVWTFITFERLIVFTWNLAV